VRVRSRADRGRAAGGLELFQQFENSASFFGGVAMSCVLL
jgi:hypothetical protein